MFDALPAPHMDLTQRSNAKNAPMSKAPTAAMNHITIRSLRSPDKRVIPTKRRP
jgi:hypothetical protein